MAKAVFVNENNKTTASCTINAGEIIFDIFEKNNFLLPHGCLAGSCGACRIEIIQGRELIAPMSEREERTILAIMSNLNLKFESEDEKIRPKYRLSCRAKIDQNHDPDAILTFKKL